MDSERAGEGCWYWGHCCMARVPAAVWTGILHYSFEDVAVMRNWAKGPQGSLLRAPYILYCIHQGRWRLLPCLQCLSGLLWIKSTALSVISVPRVIWWTGCSCLFSHGVPLAVCVLGPLTFFCICILYSASFYNLTARFLLLWLILGICLVSSLSSLTISINYTFIFKENPSLEGLERWLRG